MDDETLIMGVLISLFFLGFCSHSYSTKFFIASMESNYFVACRCDGDSCYCTQDCLTCLDGIRVGFQMALLE